MLQSEQSGRCVKTRAPNLLVQQGCKCSFCTVRIVGGEHPCDTALQCIACRFDNADIAVAGSQREVTDCPQHVSVHSKHMSDKTFSPAQRQSGNEIAAHAFSFATKGANHQYINLQLFSQLDQCITRRLTFRFLFLVPDPIQLQQAV